MSKGRQTTSERLPDFLIVGAMKAGTTTLYRDLLTQPAIFMPMDKEPHRLMTDAVLTPEGRAEYASLFRRARADQICGEASTGYTKAPEAVGVPDRALRVLGPRTRIIYLVREPVARVRSHHFHEYSAGNAPASIDEAVRTMPSLINYTRYAWQIRPWIERFGQSNVRILQFEAFTSDRAGVVSGLCGWLGAPSDREAVRTEEVFNRGEAKPVYRGPIARLNKTWLYRRLLRPLLPAESRDRLRAALLPKAPDRPAPPSPETIARIWDELGPDLQDLQRIMDRDTPIWERPTPGRPIEAGEAVSP